MSTCFIIWGGGGGGGGGSFIRCVSEVSNYSITLLVGLHIVTKIRAN